MGVRIQIFEEKKSKERITDNEKESDFVRTYVIERGVILEGDRGRVWKKKKNKGGGFFLEKFSGGGTTFSGLDLS